MMMRTRPKAAAPARNYLKRHTSSFSRWCELIKSSAAADIYHSHENAKPPPTKRVVSYRGSQIVFKAGAPAAIRLGFLSDTCVEPVA